MLESLQNVERYKLITFVLIFIQLKQEVINDFCYK